MGGNNRGSWVHVRGSWMNGRGLPILSGRNLSCIGKVTQTPNTKVYRAGSVTFRDAVFPKKLSPSRAITVPFRNSEPTETMWVTILRSKRSKS